MLGNTQNSVSRCEPKVLFFIETFEIELSVFVKILSLVKYSQWTKVMHQILPFTVVNKLFKMLLKFKSNRIKEYV